ncbi:unnamed protein product [Notodromas monacha]|uniref:Uncharacterized protein n=1 Tax=Notodromas monacha TaxID=399045 RepID=A0A7R9BVY5_9CRUS|nr:unnamed protein product [Notodromas monacha]CAG0921111.1 unnamed protein product [Notodromas monacha]
MKASFFVKICGLCLVMTASSSYATAEAEPKAEANAEPNAAAAPQPQFGGSGSNSNNNNNFGGSSGSWSVPSGVDPDLYSRTESDKLWDCYSDWRLRDRFLRTPQSMDNLIGLIRKIEAYPQTQNWDMEKTAAVILRRFRLDGIFFRPGDKNTPGNDMTLLYEGRQHEERKQTILYKLAPDRSASEFPEDALTPAEKCGLHFMLSYTINDTARPDENDRGFSSGSSLGRRKRGIFSNDDDPVGNDNQISDDNHALEGSFRQQLRDDSEDSLSDARTQPLVSMSQQQQQQSSMKQVAPNYVTSKYPLEMGVVYTPYGTVAAGAVLAGIAFGLEEQTYTVRNLLPQDKDETQLPAEIRDAQIINSFAGTIAGDIAQSAVLKGSTSIDDNKLIGPIGRWNDTVLPTEYSLDYRLEDVSFLTYAEALGGIDGLLLAKRIRDWDKTYVKLSHILELYYSNQGISFGKLDQSTDTGAGNGPVKYRACDRFNLFKNGNVVKKTELDDQASFILFRMIHIRQVKSFAYLLYAYQSPIWSGMRVETINSLVDRANKVFWRFVNEDGRSAESDTWDCPTFVPTSSNTNNNARFFDEDPNVPFETRLDIHTMLDSNAGEPEIYSFMYGISQVLARLQVDTHGTNRFGLNMTQSEQWMCFLDIGEEPNKAMVAHRMLRAESWGYSGRFNLIDTMNAIKKEHLAYTRQEYMDNSAGSNAKVFLLVVPKSKPVADGYDEDKLKEFFEHFYEDVPDAELIVLGTGTDWQRYLRDENEDFINMNSDFASKLLKRLKRVPGRLIFPRCKDGKEQETGNKYKGFYSPGTKSLLAYNPHYFFSSGSTRIKIRFISKLPVDVCAMRSLDERDSGDIKCGKVLDASDTSVTFDVKPKCGRECDPIYLTFQTDPSVDLSVYNPTCSDTRTCTFPNQVEYEITHEKMRCNSGVTISANLFAAVLLFLVTFFNR